MWLVPALTPRNLRHGCGLVIILALLPLLVAVVIAAIIKIVQLIPGGIWTVGALYLLYRIARRLFRR